MRVSTHEFPKSATAVIVGGGVMGVSAAYHLARRGVNDVVLIEKSSLGSGSTCKAAGGVRAQFSDRVNIELGVRSLETFQRFGELFGQDIDLQQNGYLFLLDSAEAVGKFEENVELQNDMGVPSRMLDVKEAKELSPLIATNGLLAAAFSPTDGHCTPESVVLGYASAARRQGARLITNCEVTGIESRDGQIRGVITDDGFIETNTVICAAGAWSQQVGQWVDVDLPVTPIRRQIMVTEPIEDLPPDFAFTIDFGTSFYFHRESNGLLVGMSDPDETPGFKLTRSTEWLPRLGEAIARRVPSLEDIGLASGWAGLYEVTPDHNALIGEASTASRFLYATGFSGHGFLQGPAVGEVIADMFIGEEPFVDITELSAERFLEEGWRPEFNIV